MKKIVSVLIVGLAASTGAFAALDPAIATGVAAVEADAVAILALVFPVIVAVWGLTMAPKLMKRFGRSI